jgi:hypothetical protein
MGFAAGKVKKGAMVEKRQGPMAEKCCYNYVFDEIFGEEKMKRREYKRMVIFEFFKTALSGPFIYLF